MLLSTIILTLLSVHFSISSENLLSKFNQNKYKIKDHRTELVSYNPTLVKSLKIVTFKHNRTTPALNWSVTYLIDVEDKLEAVVQAYKHSSNEYRHFPIRFQVNLCKVFQHNTIGLQSIKKCGNMQDVCYLRKDIHYHFCNFVPDERRFPPVIPAGRYKVKSAALISNRLHTKRGQIASCKIPQKPQHGQYIVGNDPGRYRAGECAPTYSVLILTCDKAHASRPPQANSSTCINGKWSPIPSTCSRTCASLYSSKSTNVECSFANNSLETCHNPIDGTIAKFKCETFYEDPSVELNPFRACRNGEWNGIPQCVPTCGQKRPRGRPNIINGTNVAIGSYPWHVAIYTSEKEYQCGGVIISEWIVLSAAHCFTQLDDGKLLEGNFLVGAGKYYRKYDDVRDDDAQYFSMSAILIPSQYKGHALNYVADIAVLVLATHLALSMSVQPVCVDWTNKFESEQLVANNNGEVTGFGYTQEGTKLAEQLKELSIPFVPFDECYDKVPKLFKKFLHPDKICGGYLNIGTSVCGGDSGGGFVFCPKDKERCYIRGISSVSPATNVGECDSNQFGLYTLVSKHLDFIRPLYLINGTSQAPTLSKRNDFKSDFTMERSNLEYVVKYSSLFPLSVGKVVANANYQCQQLQHCECFVTNGSYFYNCSRSLHFTLHVFGENLVEIKCLGQLFDWSNESSIPDVNSGGVEALTLTSCPLPTNFANFTKRLGIKSKIITITSSQRRPHQLGRSLPNFLFANLKSAKEIYVRNYSLVGLLPNLFTGSPSIAIISFANNKIANLPNGLFRDLINLNSLDLGGNVLQKLTFRCFFFLVQLKILNLQHNRLVDLGKKTFNKLRKLEKLDLNNNRLTNIWYGVFENLRMLKEINLANNFLIFHDATGMHNSNYAPLRANSELEVIDLSNNSIYVLPDGLVTNKLKLRRLDLSHNFIGSLAVEALMTPSGIPKTVHLEHNRISVVFFQLTDFEQENDSNSSYSTTTLLLNNNPMDCSCSVYDLTSYYNKTMRSLVATLFAIDATNLQCASPTNLAGVPIKDLLTKTCSFDDVATETCPKECHCEIRLRDSALLVDCSSRSLTAVPKLGGQTERFYNSYEVYLQDNLLTTGPDENMGYENVTKLIMSFNKITQLTWVPEKTEVLMLDNNNISYLSSEFLLMLKYSPVISLTLGNNPWMCDCSSIDFLLFLLHHLSTLHIDAERIRCRDKKRILINTSVYELCPIVPLFGYVLSSVGFISLIGLGGVVLFCHRHRCKISKWHLLKRLCQLVRKERRH